MSEIKEILDDIIKKRSGKAAEKEELEKELKRKKKFLLQLTGIYEQIAGLEVSEQEQMCGSRQMAQQLRDSKVIVDQCLKDYEQAISSVKKLRIRFQRPTIDLVVIGKIGAGKSKFLQSASGLDDNCIPSLKGTSCTGVSSVIENIEDTEKTEAHFVFKTKAEILEDMNREISNLKNRLAALVLQDPEPSDKITDLDPEQIKAAFSVLIKDAEAIIQNNKGSILETKANKLMNMAATRLKEYTDKENREEWFPYIGSSETENEMLKDRGLTSYMDGNGKYHYVLSDPSKIKLFVSKHGNAEDEYHCYIAVKEAVIKTNIKGIGARIRLVDTVGIGDPAADTVSRMQDAVRKESDGVIFISANRYRSDAKEGPDDEDMSLLQTLRELFLEHRKTDARHWMAFLQNHRKDPDDPDDQSFSLQYLKIMEKSYNGTNDMFGENGICYRRVIDVSNPKEVNVMLREFLRQIADHLDAIDERLEKESKELCSQVKLQEQKLKSVLGIVRINTPKKLSQNYIYMLVNNRLDSLSKKLKEYRLSIMKEKKKAPSEPSFLKQRIAMVQNLKNGEYLDEISASLDSMINANCESSNRIAEARLKSMKSLKKSVRKIAVLPSPIQRQMEIDYKKKIADLMIECLQIDIGRMKKSGMLSMDSDEPKFFEHIGAALLDGTCDAGEMKEIFESMNRFRLDEMNALTKALFYHHAEKYLTDEPYQDELYAQEPEESEQEETDYNNTQNKPDDGDKNKNIMDMWTQFHKSDETEQKNSQSTNDMKNSSMVYEEPEQHISKADRDNLREELRGKLDIFIQEVERDTGNENYLVEYYDQMNEELYNFMQLTGEEYRERWHIIFEEMKEQGFLIEDEQNEKRWEIMESVSENINRYFSDGQQIL